MEKLKDVDWRGMVKTATQKVCVWWWWFGWLAGVGRCGCAHHVGTNHTHRLAPQVKKYTLNLTDLELKVEEATSAETWGPHGSTMNGGWCHKIIRHRWGEAGAGGRGWGVRGEPDGVSVLTVACQHLLCFFYSCRDRRCRV